MKLHLSLYFLVLTTLAACGGTSGNPSVNNTQNSDILISEERTFDHNTWCTQSPEVFEVNISNVDDWFSIEYTIALDTAIYRYETVPFYTDIYTPDGVHRHMTPEIPIKHYGRWKGETRDGYQVISKVLYEYFAFNKAGKQRIEVRQATSQYNLEGIHSFGITIKKVELDFEKMRNS
jgi:hypothetical protein